MKNNVERTITKKIFFNLFYHKRRMKYNKKYDQLESSSNQYNTKQLKDGSKQILMAGLPDFQNCK